MSGGCQALYSPGLSRFNTGAVTRMQRVIPDILCQTE